MRTLTLALLLCLAVSAPLSAANLDAPQTSASASAPISKHLPDPSDKKKDSHEAAPQGICIPIIGCIDW